MIRDFQDIYYLKLILKNYKFRVTCFYFKQKNPRYNVIILLFSTYKYPMKYLISSKRSRALFGIGIVALSIGLISKKLISYPAGGCMKGTQEITFNI